MILVRAFIGFFWLVIFMMGVGAARAAGTGNVRALVVLIGVIALWNWRRLFIMVCERRWRP